MSLASQIVALATRIGQEIKAVRAELSAAVGVGIRETTLDFGAVPVWSKSFTFADAAITTGKKIAMTAVAPADGRSLDELEMDSLTCVATCLVNGQVTAIVTAAPGPVSGQYKFNYLVG